MIRLKRLILVTAAAVCIFCGLLSCGIEEYYFLPQPPEVITREMASNATFYLPSISSYYYAEGYMIFYRIYLSDYFTDVSISTSSLMSNINPALLSDYNALLPFVDQTVNTSLATINTFLNRNYSKLEISGDNINSVLSTNGGSINIQFPPSEPPFLTLNGGPVKHELLRSNYRKTFSFQPSDRYFFFNQALNTISENINLDIAARANTQPNHAYVSMYVIAIGTNPENWNTIISNPTFINIFKLQ